VTSCIKTSTFFGDYYWVFNLLATYPLEYRGTKARSVTAARDGFSLNCAVGGEAHERGTLERLSVDGDGLVVLELKRAFSDGTTHVLFEP
jgi:hypothetical protein